VTKAAFDPEPTFDEVADNDGFEPNVEVLNFRRERTQRICRCSAAEIHAAVQLGDQSFMHCATRIVGVTTGLRDKIVA